jgi:UDP-4-amino-4,6-dideoxy-N-acetyl-beta-L-altrosamine N-acetyltransferase
LTSLISYSRAMRSVDMFSLRLVTDEDRATLLAWRNSDRVREHMFTTSVIDERDHERWFAQALHAARDRHLVLLHSSVPIGFVSFTAVAEPDAATSWGLYVGDPAAPRGSGTALGTLALDYAFARLGARVVHSEAMSQNESAIKLYERLGFERTGSRCIHRDGTVGTEMVIQFSIAAQTWADHIRGALDA